MEATISRATDKTYLCWTVDVVLTPSSSSLLIFCSSSLLSSKNFSLSSVNVQINRFTWKTPTHSWCPNVRMCMVNLPDQSSSGAVISSVITSFSSFWTMLLLCAVSLKSFCLVWCSMVFAWICFSMYLLDRTAEERSVLASFYLLNSDITQKKMLKAMHLCILLYSLRLCSRSSFSLWLRSWLVFTCTTHMSDMLITVDSWTRNSQTLHYILVFISYDCKENAFEQEGNSSFLLNFQNYSKPDEVLSLTSSLVFLCSVSTSARRVFSSWKSWLTSALVLVRVASFTFRAVTCCCSSSTRFSKRVLKNVDGQTHGQSVLELFKGQHWGHPLKGFACGLSTIMWTGSPGGLLLMLLFSQDWEAVREIPVVPLQTVDLLDQDFLLM